MNHVEIDIKKSQNYCCDHSNMNSAQHDKHFGTGYVIRGPTFDQKGHVC